jgi:hypothetical protein
MKRKGSKRERLRIWIRTYGNVQALEMWFVMALWLFWFEKLSSGTIRRRREANGAASESRASGEWVMRRGEGMRRIELKEEERRLTSSSSLAFAFGRAMKNVHEALQ